jgi:hypothetical protein
MVGRKPRDARLNAARYTVDRLSSEVDGAAAGDEPRTDPGRASMDERAHFVEIRIQQAMRRGDFDDLPGAGKPLADLGSSDPDWWIRRKIEREQLTGLGPPALMLRAEHAVLDEKLDAMTDERDVRRMLDDFNRRVVEARRQLLGGPPVVTPTRDVEAEVGAWRARRAERIRLLDDARAARDAESAALPWRERRRRRRGR